MYQSPTSRNEQNRSASNRDWLKAPNLTLNRLDQVGPKVYNLGLAEPHNLRVNSTNLQSRANSNTSRIDPAADLLKTAWGSNTSIPDLLKKHNERVRQAKSRPESATVQSRTRHTKPKPRPQSAKELGAQEAGANKKPPKGFGVKGAHCDLGERPAGGVGIGTGTGWTAPPGGILDMSRCEIDDILEQVSSTQARQYGRSDMWITDAENFPQGCVGPPPPPRGSPDFAQMLSNGAKQGVGLGEMIDDLLCQSENATPPSERFPRPPPSPIHVTMPTATFYQSESVDTETHPNGLDNLKSIDPNKSPVKSSPRDRSSAKLKIDLNTNGSLHDDSNSEDREDDGAMDDRGWSDDDDNDIDDDLGAGYHGKQRRRTVTFNEDKNEMTIITPRSGKHRRRQPKGSIDMSLPHEVVDVSCSKPESLLKSKPYPCRPELKWVKSRIDTGLSGTEHARHETRAHSGKSSTRSHQSTSAQDKTDEKSPPKISMVSLTYFDDLLTPGGMEDSTGHEINNSPRVRPDSKKNKRHQSPKLDNIETMVSKVTLSDDEADIEESHAGSDDKSVGTKWVSPGSLTTKVVSGSSKNYYELALQSKLSQQRSQQNETTMVTKTKTIKTFEFGDGAIMEHKVVSAVDIPIHLKKEYVLPDEARPHSSARQQNPSPRADQNRSQTPQKDRSHERKESSVHGNKLNVPHSWEKVQENVNKTGRDSRLHAPPKDPGLQGEMARPKSRLAFVEPASQVAPPVSTGGATGVDNEPETMVAERSQDEQAIKQKPRAASAPAARKGPTLQNGRLTVGTALSPSPYDSPVRIRPYSASHLNDLSKKSAQGRSFSATRNVRISTRPTSREIHRTRTAVRSINKGTLFQPKNYNTERLYSNYSKPSPKPVTVYLRQKKMAEAVMAAKAKEPEPEIIEIWTRHDDFEIETDGIKECKDIQDRLLDQGVPVTMDTLTRALLPPTECAMRGTMYNISTKPTLPPENHGLLSRPSVWLPEEHAQLQKARKAAQRAEHSARQQEWEERHRMYLMSQMSSSSAKRTKKKKKPTRRKSTS